MDGIQYAVVTDKSVRLLEKNQYTLNVESGSTKTEIKHWVELFFGVKVMAMNSHRLPGKGRRMRGKGRRMRPIMGHTMHYKRMIITLQPGYSIPSLNKEALLGTGYSILSLNKEALLGTGYSILSLKEDLLGI
uniref:Large ribosomal subunit protein uL23c n=1 Tax=Passiflora suberosa TaxID=133504 RepID=A0A4Y5QE66_PASSB|nr:ribosomal protein L23 [Passiflora suberosa]YP_009670570.1 ribosomal protein L23 [Passiflora suberosa]QCX29836.1 ribosomal protein L23 [Passiflora suberosa]QCX29837.1 ribosomal protein L23 [Passiflora suberosa]